MNIEELTPEDVKSMNYNEIIGILKETNRPPGGKNTVFEIMQRTFLSKNSNVLEIGTSTGFTALEISRFIKCSIIATDINENSLEEARNRTVNEGYNNISFVKADVNSLPFKNEEFNLVIVGNVLSLMSDKEKALDECRRVCKRNGFIAVVPMYYIRQPSDELIKQVSEAIREALEMRKEEKVRRIKSMTKNLDENNVYEWAVNFVKNALSSKVER